MNVSDLYYYTCVTRVILELYIKLRDHCEGSSHKLTLSAGLLLEEGSFYPGVFLSCTRGPYAGSRSNMETTDFSIKDWVSFSDHFESLSKWFKNDENLNSEIELEDYVVVLDPSRRYFTLVENKYNRRRIVIMKINESMLRKIVRNDSLIKSKLNCVQNITDVSNLILSTIFGYLKLLVNKNKDKAKNDWLACNGRFKDFYESVKSDIDVFVEKTVFNAFTKSEVNKSTLTFILANIHVKAGDYFRWWLYDVVFDVFEDL